MISSISRETVAAFIIAFVLATATSVFAWTGPTASPPAANVAAPVNVGATSQVKSGDFWAASVGTDNGFCIGVECITSWSEASGNWTMNGSDIYFTGGSVGSDGGFCIDEDCITSWSDASGVWTTNGSHIYYNGGNVGVGTTSPGLPLSVVGAAYVTGNVTAAGFFHNSDERLKKNITTIDNPLSILNGIRGVAFNWKDSNSPALGVVAQDVERVAPSAVQVGPNGYKTVEYDQLVGVLIEAVKEQQQRIDALEYEVAQLKASQ